MEVADLFPTKVVGESCGIGRVSRLGDDDLGKTAACAIGPSFSSEPEGSRKTATAEGSRSRDQRLARRCFLWRITDQRCGKEGPIGASYCSGYGVADG